MNIEKSVKKNLVKFEKMVKENKEDIVFAFIFTIYGSCANFGIGSFII